MLNRGKKKEGSLPARKERRKPSRSIRKENATSISREKKEKKGGDASGLDRGDKKSLLYLV